MELTTISTTTEPQKASGGERYYRPELDVLRFIAFLMVFLSHRQELAPIERATHPWFHVLSLIGILGVPVFFLLSAFLITELLIREQDLTGTIHLKAFYIRRILRIWPLYFAAFYGLAILARFVPHVGATTPGSWLAFSLFYGNWYVGKYGWLDAYPTNPFWSISVEEQFYIAIPLIALFGRRRGLIAVCLALLLIAYVTTVEYSRHVQTDFSGQWTNSFIQFQFFAAGTLLSLALKGWLPHLTPPSRMASIAVGIGCWLMAFLRFGASAGNPYPASAAGSVTWWLLVLAGVLFLFFGALGTPARYLPKAAIYLGRISYGLYIFHGFCIYLVFRLWGMVPEHWTAGAHPDHGRNILATVIAFGLTILMAALSYRILEKPFLRMKRHFTHIPSRD